MAGEVRDIKEEAKPKPRLRRAPRDRFFLYRVLGMEDAQQFEAGVVAQSSDEAMAGALIMHPHAYNCSAVPVARVNIFMQYGQPPLLFG